MICIENNNDINLKIALELAQKRFNDIDEEELKNNTAEVAKEYKSFIMEVLKELQQYDVDNSILDYYPSV